jgi:hypothetical protein
MKVCAVSPWTTASATDILSFLGGATAELVVLPGACLWNTPSPQEVQRVIGNEVAVFVEYGGSKGKAVPYLVTRAQVVSMPLQIFSRSPTAKRMDELAAAWPGRTFSVGSRIVTFAICGEINGFNRDGQPKLGRNLPFDILANPAYTVMGRWQHLGRKLSALSKGKVVIHVANNNRNHERLRTDVRLYVDEVLQERETQNAGKLKSFECEF